MSWKDFRGNLIGPTNPANAPAGSIRGMIAAKWQELGLPGECNGADNGVHASASPLEVSYLHETSENVAETWKSLCRVMIMFQKCKVLLFSVSTVHAGPCRKDELVTEDSSW